MMRRRQTDTDGSPLPRKLRRFKVGEWPGQREWAQFEHYTDALDQYAAEHPELDVYALTETPPEVAWSPDIDGI